MIDLHCHILPGVDDGPKELEESLELARLAEQDGITDIVATPHNHRALRTYRTDVIPRVEALNRALQGANIAVTVWPGAENQLNDLQRYRDDCENGALCHLGDLPHFTLVEWPWDERAHARGEVELMEWLREREITPIIAHPERHAFFRDDFPRLDALTKAGAWIQITAGSLLGHHGREAQRASKPLLERYSNAVLATDSHGLSRRSGLCEGYKWVEQNIGHERADDLRARSQAVLKRIADR